MTLLTKKNAFDSPARADGMRILVTRHWPRGRRREVFDIYLPDLAPSKPLLKSFRGGKISWAKFRTSYRAEMKSQKSLIRLLQYMHDGDRRLTILCTCKTDKECHRRLLADLIERSP